MTTQDSAQADRMFFQFVGHSKSGSPTEVQTNLLGELREYFKIPTEVTDTAILDRCRNATQSLTDEWRGWAKPLESEGEITQFYRTTHQYCYELVGLDIASSAHRRQQLFEFQALLKEKGKVKGLDYGSGVGSTGLYLRGCGFEVDYADVSKTNLGFIQLRSKNRGFGCTTYDLVEQSIPESTYDFILAMDVLEHVPDPLKTLNDLHRYLKPDGLLFFNLIVNHNDHDGDPLHLLQDPYLIRKNIRKTGFARVGSVGEFKIYQRSGLPKPLRTLFGSFDHAFWAFRQKYDGIRAQLKSKQSH
ncbi:MAG: class I SAM-dependent methyltransferase [Bdellovibrionales bacterium]|nr:class I SAM-dependent methyltransferase [Bdellovibrionales bacterium]